MPTSFLSLPTVEKLSNSLTLRHKDELDILVIDHPKVKAALSLQGAQLLRWQPHGEKPVIWLSDKTLFKKGKAIRGGVPICWPWFGKVMQPSHGFARNSLWQLTAYSEDQDGVLLTLTLTDSDETIKLWPYKFTLIARYKLAKQCEIELEAFGDFLATAALHSYFEIGDIEHITVSGLGEHYHDKVSDEIIHSPAASLTFSDETDRVYTSPRSVNLIHDKRHHRVIEITHHSYSDVVVWNPFKSASATMSDMSSQGYKTMVCVETARINKPLLVTENSPARFGVTIEVKPQYL
jgi:glucose-6-phosphate 1-epimerase